MTGDNGESWLMMAQVDNEPSLDIDIMIIGSIIIGTCKHHLPPLPIMERQLGEPISVMIRYKQTIKQLQQIKFAAMTAAKNNPGEKKHDNDDNSNSNTNSQYQ